MDPEEAKHYLNHPTEDTTVCFERKLQMYMDGELVPDYLGNITETKSTNASAVSVYTLTAYLAVARLFSKPGLCN